MSQRLTVELSDETFGIIEREAKEANLSPAEVASVSLDRYFGEQRGKRGRGRKAQGQTKKNEAELKAARERFERHFGSVDLGYATGIDNEDIDADLEREFANSHEKA
jgi:hypothetical protein